MLFERAVTLDPRYARAHLELGVAYATKADYLAMPELRPRAVASLRRAIELQPDRSRAWRELGLVLVGMGQDAEGIDAIHRALEIDPDDAGAHGAMGARALHRPRAALPRPPTWFERALAAKPERRLVRAAARALCGVDPRLRPRRSGGPAGDRAAGGVSLGPRGRPHRRRVDAARPPGGAAGTACRGGRELPARDRVPDDASITRCAAASSSSSTCGSVRSYLALGETRKGHAVLDVAIEGFDRRVRLGADDPFTRYYAAAVHALQGRCRDGDRVSRARGRRAAGVHDRARPHRARVRRVARGSALQSDDELN